MTLEKLAEMMQRGFEGTATKAEMIARFEAVDERFRAVDERFNKIDNDISYLHGSFGVMQRELAEIKIKLDHAVYREELEEVKTRIIALEKKLARIKK